MSQIQRQNNNEHLSLKELWAYRNGRQQLSAEEIDHLVHCDDCLSLLGLCQISDSIGEVEARLRRRMA
jgi:hypothetical protein